MNIFPCNFQIITVVCTPITFPIMLFSIIRVENTGEDYRFTGLQDIIIIRQQKLLENSA